jgi:hypothetical protein
MTEKNKAQIKTLEMAVSAMRTAAKTRNIYERQAAVDLEVEFNERIEAIKKADKEPELSLHSVAVVGGGR